MHRGWVRIYRRLIHSQEWLDMKDLPKGFPRPCAWIDLICLANHTEGYVRPRGDGLRVKVQRGQCGWSIKKFAERWGWSATRAKCYLLELVDDAQITMQNDNKTSIITVINYDLYQGEVSQTEPQKVRRRCAEDAQINPNNKNKEVKELKEEETGGPPSSPVDILTKELRASFDLVWTLWPKGKKKSKGEAEKAWKKIKPDMKLTAGIMAGLKRASASKEWAKEDRKYIPHPATWLNAKGWEDEYEELKAGGNGSGSGSGARRPDAGDLIREAEEELEKQEGPKA